SLSPYFGQLNQYFMTKIQRQRHVVFCFFGSKPKHHALVSGALLFGSSPVDSLVYVWRLLMNSRKYPARIAFKHIFALGVTNFVDYISGNLLDVEISI